MTDSEAVTLSRLKAGAETVYGCYPCEQTARIVELEVRERIYDDRMWRVAHSFNSALPGWLVLLSHRHITSPAELTVEEAAALGPLIRDLSVALAAVTGCVKSYVMIFAESQGFQHLHFHIVPRMLDLPDDRKGPNIFSYLTQAEDQRVPTTEMDRIALSVREYLKTIRVGIKG